MIQIRRSQERGHADHGWLQSAHSFSFADYYDPQNMGFGPLRVINDDRIAAGTGFGMHGHRDMEIVTYMLEGELAHKDSMGNGSVIRAGDVQRMSAGTGVLHSEFNRSAQRTHLLQIWIEPAAKGIAPSYEEQHVEAADKRGRLRLIAAPADGGEAGAAVRIHQDARLYAGLFDGDESAQLKLAPQRRAYAHVARGAVTINGVALEAGDALALTDEPGLAFTQGREAEVLVFDLPL
jgi:redox-sensitive bicupin YhaK (pirin superfamily)